MTNQVERKRRVDWMKIVQLTLAVAVTVPVLVGVGHYVSDFRLLDEARSLGIPLTRKDVVDQQIDGKSTDVEPYRNLVKRVNAEPELKAVSLGNSPAGSVNLRARYPWLLTAVRDCTSVTRVDTTPYQGADQEPLYTDKILTEAIPQLLITDILDAVDHGQTSNAVESQTDLNGLLTFLDRELLTGYWKALAIREAYYASLAKQLQAYPRLDDRLGLGRELARMTPEPPKAWRVRAAIFASTASNSLSKEGELRNRPLTNLQSDKGLQLPFSPVLTYRQYLTALVLSQRKASPIWNDADDDARFAKSCGQILSKQSGKHEVVSLQSFEISSQAMRTRTLQNIAETIKL